MHHWLRGIDALDYLIIWQVSLVITTQTLMGLANPEVGVQMSTLEEGHFLISASLASSCNTAVINLLVLKDHFANFVSARGPPLKNCSLALCG